MPAPRFCHPLTFALVLLVALACDETAPTETRAPAGPAGNGPGGDEPEVLSEISTMAIALPVNQSIATAAPAPAFRVNQTGSGPNGIFQITNSANTQNALQGLTNGRGRAGFFRIQNTVNTAAALFAQTNGTGPAFQAAANGSISSFGVPATANAGLFRVTNSTNLSPALLATSVGRGPAGQFDQTNPGPSFAALEVSCNGSNCRGARLLNSGTGQAALIIVTNPNNTEPALWVRSDAAAASALFVSGHSTFNGNVDINGTLTKDAGAFKIDHPMDPEHKTLSHSFVESPDMKNVYDGTVMLDANGRATVALPDYFEALNQDFRYQLTAIGAPGPNLYIAEGVQQNRFRIAGGRPYARVSWMVTGIRKDAYAEEHRIKVEEEKPAAEPSPAAGTKQPSGGLQR